MSENVGKSFAKYVSLNIIGMLAASAMFFIDAIFISIALGVQGLTSVSLVAPVFVTVFGLGVMIGEGGGSKYAANMAVGKLEKANAFFTLSVKSCFVVAIPLVIIGLFFSEQLSALLGAKGDILPMVSSYVRIFLTFSPIIILFYSMESLVRNDEAPSTAMIASVILYSMNILLDYIFIIVLGLGMLGSGLATSVAAILALGYLLYHWRKKARFRFVKVFMTTKKAKAIFAIGAPSFAGNVLGGLNALVFNWLFLRHIGDIGVAAFGIVTTLSVLVNAVFLGIAQGMQPMASHFYGMKDRKNLNKVLKFSIATSIFVACLFVAVAFLFTQFLIAIFNREQDIVLAAQLVSIATVGIRVYFLAYIFVGITVISTYFLAATGSPNRALLLSILQAGGIIPFVILLSYFTGVLGIWVSYPVFELPLVIISILFLAQTSKLCN